MVTLHDPPRDDARALIAALRGGVPFSGPFVRLNQCVSDQSLAPTSDGWPSGWTDWQYWGLYPDTTFALPRPGKVMANLQAPDGERARCLFQLNAPSWGMRGGAVGECQLSTHQIVQAAVASRCAPKRACASAARASHAG